MEQEPAPNHAGSRPHTRNERLIVELPLSAVEVRQRDRCMMFHGFLHLPDQVTYLLRSCCVCDEM